MMSLTLYALLCTATYYLLARAMITHWLWSRYPAWLDYYFTCAACSGFLYGLIAGAIGGQLGLSFLGLPGPAWYTPIVTALCSMIWTPVLADLHINALLRLGVPDARLSEDEKPPKTGE